MPDHLTQHAQTVLLECIGLSDTVHDGDFNGSNDSQLVAHLRDDRVLRVVRDAQEVASQLFQCEYIFNMDRIVEGIASVTVVLVTAGADEFYRLPVEGESFLGVEAEPAHSSTVHDLVEHIPLLVG